jgi:hypothetical protein
MAMILRTRSSTGLARVLRRAALASAGVAAAALVVFHAWLLWVRASRGSILDAEVALRWGVSALLLGGVLALRRLGFSPLRGRNAVVFWACVAMLHWSAGSPETRSLATDSSAAAEALFLLPSAVALSAGALLVFLCARRPHRPRRFAAESTLPFAASWALHTCGGAVFAPRPPPA